MWNLGAVETNSCPPQKLIIQLKRFGEVSDWRVKDDQFVTYPFDLSLSIKNNLNCIYKLNSVIMHNGTYESGHYKALCLNADTNTWCVYDDDNPVKVVSMGQVIHKDAYILIYQRYNIEI